MPKKKTDRMASYSDKRDYAKRLKDAAYVDGRTKKQVQEEQAIDNVFKDIEEPIRDTRNPVEKFWDYLTEGD